MSGGNPRDHLAEYKLTKLSHCLHCLPTLYGALEPTEQSNYSQLLRMSAKLRSPTTNCGTWGGVYIGSINRIFTTQLSKLCWRLSTKAYSGFSLMFAIPVLQHKNSANLTQLVVTLPFLSQKELTQDLVWGLLDLVGNRGLPCCLEVFFSQIS